jgi:hypothetical protein
VHRLRDGNALIFILGGGNSLGSSAGLLAGGAPTYRGDRLAAFADAVVITVNYRIGPLGFLAPPTLDAEASHGTSGNYGILDLVAALGWVRDSVANVGGDPQRRLSRTHPRPGRGPDRLFHDHRVGHRVEPSPGRDRCQRECAEPAQFDAPAGSLGVAASVQLGVQPQAHVGCVNVRATLAHLIDQGGAIHAGGISGQRRSFRIPSEFITTPSVHYGCV